MKKLAVEDAQADGLYRQIFGDVFWRLQFPQFLGIKFCKVHKVNLNLQNPRIDINTSVNLMKSLQSWIGGLRENFQDYMNEKELNRAGTVHTNPKMLVSVLEMCD